MFITRLDTSDVDLLPFDRHVVGFEYSLYRLSHFSSNAVSYQDFQLSCSM